MEEILEAGSGPSLQEIGPYVFREEREKVNVTFSDDGNKVGYNQVRTWFFEPQMSANLSLDYAVYHLNVPLIVSFYSFELKVLIALNSNIKLFRHQVILS